MNRNYVVGFGLAALGCAAALLAYGYITDAQWLEYATRVTVAVIQGLLT